jgi:hypothetical protein
VERQTALRALPAGERHDAETGTGEPDPKEYAQVVAYLLKINEAPAGKEELPPDAEALKKIKCR